MKELLYAILFCGFFYVILCTLCNLWEREILGRRGWPKWMSNPFDPQDQG